MDMVKIRCKEFWNRNIIAQVNRWNAGEKRTLSSQDLRVASVVPAISWSVSLPGRFRQGQDDGVGRGICWSGGHANAGSTLYLYWPYICSCLSYTWWQCVKGRCEEIVKLLLRYDKCLLLIFIQDKLFLLEEQLARPHETVAARSRAFAAVSAAGGAFSSLWSPVDHILRPYANVFQGPLSANPGDPYWHRNLTRLWRAFHGVF